MQNVKFATVLAAAGMAIGASHGYARDDKPSKDVASGVVLQREGLAAEQIKLAKVIAAAPDKAMKQCGLAGAMGELHVRVTSSTPQMVLLPMPQLTDGQVPICYAISGTPADAVTEYRLRKNDDGTVAVEVRLAGKKQEVGIAWSAVVLLSGHAVTPNRTAAKPYRTATPCVQSEAAEVKKLAVAIFPESGQAKDYAATIQKHIQGMKRAARPRSLDAAGILKSGDNSICTANANIASALMRSKGIACRSVAVVPVTAQRLEMHRVAEFAERDRWIAFDPSSLQIDIPAKPWQNIVMAKSTIKDEEAAMKPRMGVMVGCPYGQEVELLTPGVTLFGRDFFWTTAKPLVEFDVSENATRLAAAAWAHSLDKGTPGSFKAATAKSAIELIDSLKTH